jgi:hypothetical protein
VLAAAADARDREQRIARAPRLAHAMDETWDTLNLTADESQRAVLEDVLFGFGVALDYGAEMIADDAAQWLMALEWLRTRPLERPVR